MKKGGLRQQIGALERLVHALEERVNAEDRAGAASPIAELKAGLASLRTAIGSELTKRRQTEAALNASKRELEEDTLVLSALARIGHEMIAQLNSPTLLNRLCELTAEALGCELSHTLLWRPDENTYAPMAGYGATPEEDELVRVLRVPPGMMGILFERLNRDDVAEVSTVPPDLISISDQRRFGVMNALCMALRRGNEIIGIQTAVYRGQSMPFTRTHRRIARSIAQIASMVLAHARLVAELEQANRLKSDFVTTMSHELRTPLNVILGYNDLLLTGEFGPLAKEQRSILERIDEQSKALLRLINATLDLSRLESAPPSLALADISVRDLLDELASETRDLQQHPDIQFRWIAGASVPTLYTDVLKLKIVLKNLFANAVKFTERGEIIVRAQERPPGVEIEIADTGIGIPAEVQEFIFEPFRQGDSGITRRYGGVGLGLYIARRLVDWLGGALTFESEVGRGSSFRVWLPPRTDARPGKELAS